MTDSNREHSAIDAIYRIEQSLNELLKRVRVIEDNVKVLNNKVSKLPKNALPNPPTPFDKDEDRPVARPRQQKVETLVLGNIKLHGYIVNNAKVPIDGVTVNVYNNDNHLVKTVKTSSDGHWEVRLPSGRFGVEYIHKKFKPVNKTVDLEDGTKEYEVR